MSGVKDLARIATAGLPSLTSRRMATALLLGLTATTLTIAGGCRGGGGGGYPTGVSKPKSSSVLLTPSPGETSQPAVLIPIPTDSTAASPVADTPGIALARLLNNGLNATYRVTYRTESPDGEVGDEITIFNRPPLSRLDRGSPGAAQPDSTTIQRRGGPAIVCSASPEWQCLQVSELGGPIITSGGPIFLPNADEFSSAAVTELEPRIIAGVAVRCFSVAPIDPSLTVDYCLDGDGVPLESKSALGTVDASSISSAVTDADFIVPE
jgi:hypothetical protein